MNLDTVLQLTPIYLTASLFALFIAYSIADIFDLYDWDDNPATKRDILRQALPIISQIAEELEIAVNEDDIEVKLLLAHCEALVNEKGDTA